VSTIIIKLRKKPIRLYVNTSKFWQHDWCTSAKMASHISYSSRVDLITGKKGLAWQLPLSDTVHTGPAYLFGTKTLIQNRSMLGYPKNIASSSSLPVQDTSSWQKPSQIRSSIIKGMRIIRSSYPLSHQSFDRNGLPLASTWMRS
jgi:hypothetical protein